jgi:serine/threonine-protein kinase
MRCHDAGMKDFSDMVRPALEKSRAQLAFKQFALQLYPAEGVMDRLIKEDGDRFMTAMKEVLGKEQTTEPLIPVSRRFLDAPLQLGTAAGELGLAKPDGLEAVFVRREFGALGLVPLAAKGIVRRDAWEDYYDLVVDRLGLGMPVAPLDGGGRRDFPAGPPPFEVELKTNHANNLFKPGELASVFIVNKGHKPLYVELINTGIRGEKSILVPGGAVVQPGETLKYPPGKQGIKVQPRLGKEQLTLFASEAEFPAGELLRGEGVTDRVIHRFLGYEQKDGRLKVTGDLSRIVKKTIEIETR